MRRRWPLIVVMVIAAVVVGGLLWARSRDYLVEGSRSRVPADARVVENESAAPDEPEEVAIVPYRDGARVVYGFSLHNDGPLPVKVTEIERPEAPDETVFMFRPVAVRMAARYPEVSATMVPFRPFTLDPGDERYVEVVGRLGDCEHYEVGSGEFIDAQHVRFEVLWQDLEAVVPLPRRIEWRITRATRCPR